MSDRYNIIKIVLRLLLLIAVITGLLYFYFNCRLENCEIVNTSIYSDEEIKERLFTWKADEYPMLYWLRTKLSIGDDIPFVEKFDVELKDKNSVKIYVYDKKVIGCVQHMNSYEYFDREGTIVESSSFKIGDIPLIKGIEFTSLTMGKKLEAGTMDIYDEILNVLQLLEKNGLEAEWISYDAARAITLQIGKDKVDIGKGKNCDYKINNLKNMLTALHDSKGYDAGFMIDLRNYSEENNTVTVRSLSE